LQGTRVLLAKLEELQLKVKQSTKGPDSFMLAILSHMISAGVWGETSAATFAKLLAQTFGRHKDDFPETAELVSLHSALMMKLNTAHHCPDHTFMALSCLTPSRKVPSEGNAI